MSNYTGDEIRLMFNMSRTLAYRRLAKAIRLGVDVTKTGNLEVDKERMKHAFQSRYGTTVVQSYRCVGCGETHLMHCRGRRRIGCPKCFPDASARNRQFQFKLTEPQFQALLTAQDHKCAICKRPLVRNKIKGSQNFACIDHDHKTDEIRALLCPRCNNRIEPLEDPEFCAIAIAYLIQHGSVCWTGMNDKELVSGSPVPDCVTPPNNVVDCNSMETQ